MPGTQLDVTEERAHDPAAPPESEGIPETADDASPRPSQDYDPQRVATPGEAPVGVEDYGTTLEEARHGEPLSSKLNREQPDTATTTSTGERLVEPDEGSREDTEKDMIGQASDAPHGDLSAEEAAIHEEPPGP